MPPADAGGHRLATFMHGASPMTAVHWRVARILLLVLGATLLAILVWQNDPLALLASIRQMAWLLLIVVVAVAGFVAAQLSGALGGGGRALGRFGVMARLAGGLGRVDDSLAQFYRREPVRLTLSIFFHFLGWLASALETWLI